MTEIQYLKSRIKDLEKGLSAPGISPAEQKQYAHALLNCRLDLKRALSSEKSNQAR